MSREEVFQAAVLISMVYSWNAAPFTFFPGEKDEFEIRIVAIDFMFQTSEPEKYVFGNISSNTFKSAIDFSRVIKFYLWLKLSPDYTRGKFISGTLSISLVCVRICQRISDPKRISHYRIGFELKATDISVDFESRHIKPRLDSINQA